MKNLSSFLALSLLLVLSCSSGAQKLSGKPFAMSFENSKKMGMPPVQFEILIPEGAKEVPVKKNEPPVNYVEIEVRQDGKLVESISLGYYEKMGLMHSENPMIQGMAKNLEKNLVNNFRFQFESQYPGSKVEVKKAKFLGQDREQMWMWAHIKDAKENLDDDFLILASPLALAKGQKNGLFVIAQANLSASQIRSHQDFQKLGLPGHILKSLTSKAPEKK